MFAHLKRRAKHKIYINNIKDKNSAFEAIRNYGIKLDEAINTLRISESCTELSEETKNKIFELFKMGGECDLRILAKALPIIKNKGNFAKYDFGNASFDGIYKNLGSMFRTKNRDDKRIIYKLGTIFSAIKNSYKNTIKEKSKIVVTCNDMNSALKNKTLTDNNAALSAYVFGLAGEKFYDKIHPVYQKIEEKDNESKNQSTVENKTEKRKTVSKPKTPEPKKVEIEKPTNERKTRKEENEQRKKAIYDFIGEKTEQLKTNSDESECYNKFNEIIKVLLNKDTYRFATKKSAENYNKENIMPVITEKMKVISKKLTSLKELDKYYTQDKQDDYNNETVKKSYAAYIDMFLQELNSLKNENDIDKLYTSLCGTESMLIRFVDGNELTDDATLGKHTILFVIRMLKNQIKNLKKYNIFPGLKLEKN